MNEKEVLKRKDRKFGPHKGLRCMCEHRATSLLKRNGQRATIYWAWAKTIYFFVGIKIDKCYLLLCQSWTVEWCFQLSVMLIYLGRETWTCVSVKQMTNKRLLDKGTINKVSKDDSLQEPLAHWNLSIKKATFATISLSKEHLTLNYLTLSDSWR